MKFRKPFKNYTLFIVLFALAVAGCHDKSGQTITKTTTTTNIPPALTMGEDSVGGYAEDLWRLEWANMDVISIANAAGSTYNGALLRTTVSGCATVGTDTFSTPHQIVIRFGPSDCICLDGRSRRGTIVVSFNGQFSDSGGVHTITYNNYFVNGFQVTGSKVMTNLGTDAHGQPSYAVTMNDSLIIALNGITSWTGNRVETVIAGYSTQDRSDDVFTVTGNATLTRNNGHVFNYDITSAVQLSQNCPLMVSGVATVTSPVFTTGTRTLDFGSGSCDNLLRLTIDTAVYNIVFE